MPKIEVSKVAEILKKNQVAPTTLRAVIEEMNVAVQPDPGAEEKPPAVKKQFVILIPEGLDIGWVLQVPETESAATVSDRISRAAEDFNCSKKGRLLPVKTVADAIECVPAKFFKEADTWVKTKTPVAVIRTKNTLL